MDMMPNQCQRLFSKELKQFNLIFHNFFELFPGADGSLQWEWQEHRKNGRWDIIEVYPLKFYFTDNDDVEKEFNTPEEIIIYLKEKYKCLAG